MPCHRLPANLTCEVESGIAILKLMCFNALFCKNLATFSEVSFTVFVHSLFASAVLVFIIK